MKSLIAILAIIAMLLNTFFIVNLPEEIIETGPDDQQNGENYIPPDFTVTVPARKVGDVVQYDLHLFAEMYSENRSSGEWERYSINAYGSLTNALPEPLSVEDGFGVDHLGLKLSEETRATVTIRVEESEGEPLEIHGSMHLARDQYMDLNAKNIIKTVTDGHVEVDQIPRFPLPISYDGYLRQYPDPNRPREKTLEEQILESEPTLNIGDNGTIIKKGESEWFDEYYDWSVEMGEVVGGYKTLKVNVTTPQIWSFIDYNRGFWYANEVPLPVKLFDRTNTSWGADPSENYTGYFILEQVRTLKESKGYIQGTKSIPWGSCPATAHYLTRHPRGEYKTWDYTPESGDDLESSSFRFGITEAKEYAVEHSQGLRDFITNHDNVMVNFAWYNVTDRDNTDTERQAGTYEWNISFVYKPTSEEWKEYRENDEHPEKEYNVVVSKTIRKPLLPLGEYEEELALMDNGILEGYTARNRTEFGQNGLTLAAAEAILKRDPDVTAEVYLPIINEINFQETTFALVMANVETTTIPGMSMIETITGITFPTSSYSWGFQAGTVWEGGSTFSAAVDVETGQMLYIMRISGTELFSIFTD